MGALEMTHGMIGDRPFPMAHVSTDQHLEFH
jgi:hypothetical protein